MPADFGLMVGRYNTATPTLSPDNDLREARLDVGGRIVSRPADGNDKTLSYFAEGDAVGSGVGDAIGTAGDRGILIMGRDAADAVYKAVRLASDGSLIVTNDGGVDASEAADKANANNGEVTLNSGNWVLIQSKAFSSGKFHVDGWSYASDKNTIFQLAVAVHAGGGSPVRTDITELLDSQISTSSRPSDHVHFGRKLDRSGAANTFLCVFAKQLQTGTAGVGLSMMAVDTTA